MTAAHIPINAGLSEKIPYCEQVYFDGVSYNHYSYEKPKPINRTVAIFTFILKPKQCKEQSQSS